MKLKISTLTPSGHIYSPTGHIYDMNRIKNRVSPPLITEKKVFMKELGMVI